jgi:hypothetical protein
MKTKTTLADVIEFASRELEAARIRNARVDRTLSSLYMQVCRSFAVEGTIALSFRPEVQTKGSSLWRPVVTVNFPACNKGIVEAAAFLHLVSELVPLAASLQAQLDEFEVPMQPGEG